MYIYNATIYNVYIYNVYIMYIYIMYIYNVYIYIVYIICVYNINVYQSYSNYNSLEFYNPMMPIHTIYSCYIQYTCINCDNVWWQLFIPVIPNCCFFNFRWIESLLLKFLRCKSAMSQRSNKTHNQCWDPQPYGSICPCNLFILRKFHRNM